MLAQEASQQAETRQVAPFKTQLLKWVGNKQKFAHEIISYFPRDMDTYIEPFLGSGAVMATLVPKRAIGADVFAPLMEIWDTLKSDPDRLKGWYATRYAAFDAGDRATVYEKIKTAYNAHPNGADFLFLSRSCYGGVVRFRKKDGYMSTPCGSHPPISPVAFARRVDIWAKRMGGAQFRRADFADTMARARPGDLVYCDPPYSDSQTILYGAQSFVLDDLFVAIRECKSRGVRVALSIDGSKKSGRRTCDIDIPSGLFEREIRVNAGRSLLRCFQMGGQTLEQEQVSDRLLLTY
ncbi:MAG: DNA adenine methylase [Pseudomonadota bacterium]